MVALSSPPRMILSFLHIHACDSNWSVFEIPITNMISGSEDLITLKASAWIKHVQFGTNLEENSIAFLFLIKLSERQNEVLHFFIQSNVSLKSRTDSINLKNNNNKKTCITRRTFDKRKLTPMTPQKNLFLKGP